MRNECTVFASMKLIHTSLRSLTSGVVLRRSNTSRASCFLTEVVRRRSCFGFDNGMGFTAPLLFALVILLLLFLPKNVIKWPLE